MSDFLSGDLVIRDLDGPLGLLIQPTESQAFYPGSREEPIPVSLPAWDVLTESGSMEHWLEVSLLLVQSAR